MEKGFTRVEIQSDSQVLVGILQRRFRCPWRIRNEVDQIWELVADVARISHCFRAANRVADILANVGVSHQHQPCVIYEHIHTFPKLARGEVRLDRLGMSSVRRIRGASVPVRHGGEIL